MAHKARAIGTSPELAPVLAALDALELPLLLLGEVVAQLVVVLHAVPLFLPVVLAEARVVLHRGDEGVARGDGVEDRQAGGRAHRVRVGRQLGALEDERAQLGVLLDGLLGELDDVRGGRLPVDLPPLCDGLAEDGHVLAADDHEAVVVGVDAALLLDRGAHRLERVAVGGEDGDELVLGVGGGDGGRRAQRRHEDRLLGVLARLVLQVEEEAAVGGDARDVLLLVEVLDGIDEALHHVWRQGLPRHRDGVLAHLEGQSRDRAVVHIVRVGVGAVDVARGRGVVVIQSNYAKARGGSLLGLGSAAGSAQVLDGERAGQSEGAKHACVRIARCAWRSRHC
mmetsp:Transcript_5673/g.14028  ORF Transcript_5673/g.14028 Transcript_5673/m.14028 type:complete len:339 (+) Transcript_5673:195-1211(+)